MRLAIGISVALAAIGNVSAQPFPTISAILVSLDEPQKRIELTSPSEGVWFDIDGNGATDQVAWTKPDANVAFLAWDRNENGRIDDGTELISSVTMGPERNYAFAVLINLQRARNGRAPQAQLTIDDPLYAKLLLWVDRNHNGLSEVGELRAAGEVFAGIPLNFGVEAPESGYRASSSAVLRTAPGRNPLRPEPGDPDNRLRDLYEIVLRPAR